MHGLLRHQQVETVEPAGLRKDDDAADGLVVDPHRLDMHGVRLRRDAGIEVVEFAKLGRLGARDQLMDRLRQRAAHVLAPLPVGHQRGIGRAARMDLVAGEVEEDQRMHHDVLDDRRERLGRGPAQHPAEQRPAQVEHRLQARAVGALALHQFRLVHRHRGEVRDRHQEVELLPVDLDMVMRADREHELVPVGIRGVQRQDHGGVVIARERIGAIAGKLLRRLRVRDDDRLAPFDHEARGARIERPARRHQGARVVGGRIARDQLGIAALAVHRHDAAGPPAGVMAGREHDLIEDGADLAGGVDRTGDLADLGKPVAERRGDLLFSPRLLHALVAQHSFAHVLFARPLHTLAGHAPGGHGAQLLRVIAMPEQAPLPALQGYCGARARTSPAGIRTGRETRPQPLGR